MAEPDKQLKEMLNMFLAQDEQRHKDPLFGTRAAEQTLMSLCEFIKSEGTRISSEARQGAVSTLQKMNLVPYRSYCREHLLDIGVMNV